MIRRVRKTYPAIKPVRTVFSASLFYSLVICLVAVMLPLHESLNVWTLVLFVLTATAALPHVLPRLRKATTVKHPHKQYDRLLLAVLLGSLGFMAYTLYFTVRSVSGVGVDPGSQEHASATTLAYLTIFLGCAVSMYYVKKQIKSVALTTLSGICVFALLAYTSLGHAVGFGALLPKDYFVIFGLTALFAGIVYLMYHGRHHTRQKLFADHAAETLSKHTAKR